MPAPSPVTRVTIHLYDSSSTNACTALIARTQTQLERIRRSGHLLGLSLAERSLTPHAALYSGHLSTDRLDARFALLTIDEIARDFGAEIAAILQQQGCYIRSSDTLDARIEGVGTAGTLSYAHD